MYGRSIGSIFAIHFASLYPEYVFVVEGGQYLLRY